MEINVEDYIPDERLIEIAEEIFRSKVAEYLNENNTVRILSNMSYNHVQSSVDEVAPNYKDKIVGGIEKFLRKPDSIGHQVFREKSRWGGEESVGQKILENSVKENKDLIEQSVRDCITNKEYSDDVWSKFESLSEDFMSNIYSLVEFLREGKTKEK